MYQYQPSINQEFILQRYSQEEIFRFLLGEEIFIGKYYYFAPYRRDKTPGCFFNYYKNYLYFVDFANTPSHFNCFQLWSLLYDIDIDLVPEAIYNSIESLDPSTIKGKRLKENFTKPTITPKPKNPTIITILPRTFIVEDKTYWAQYGITSAQLKSDKVIPVSAFKVETNKIFCQKPQTLCYAYTDFENNHKKIYQPYGSKHEKWITNCNKNDIGQIKNLTSIPDQLIISKSYKDCRVLRNHNFASVWFQNEGQCPEEELLVSLLKGVKKIRIFFDNDHTGLTKSAELSQKIQALGYEAKPMALPEFLLKQHIKDISDLYSAKGQTEVLNFLNQYKL